MHMLFRIFLFQALFANAIAIGVATWLIAVNMAGTISLIKAVRL